MNSSRLTFLFIAFLITFFQAPSIFAQCYINDYGWRWSSNTVTYHINSGLGTAYATQQDYETAIQSAAKQWNDAGSNFHFTKGINVSYVHGIEPDTIYQVGWYVLSNDTNHAFTVVNLSNDVITKVETYFNQSFAFSTSPDTTSVDLLSTILHEFGHWLYLDDENDPSCSSNVMYYGLAKGDTSHRNLTEDDKSGIISIYGSTNGVEDYIVFTQGPTTITQNNTYYYPISFVDVSPYGNYLVGSSFSIFVEHGEGEYVAATSTSPIIYFGTLPYGYYWLRNANGNVLARVRAFGIDNEGYSHTAYYDITISGVPPNTTSGTFTHNETWGDQNILTGNVIVPANITLKILSGAKVKFQNGVSLVVNGTMNANGNFFQRITFTSATGTTPGSWNCVQITNGGSILKYCTFEYATYGLFLYNATAGNQIDIENCIFRKDSIYGLRLNGSNAKVKSCEIKNNPSGIFCTANPTVNFIGDSIHHNTYGIQSFSSNLLQFYGNVIDSNGSHGLYTRNSDLIYLGHPYTWQGYNTICRNGGDEVRAYSGNPNVQICYSSIHDTTPYPPYEIYNYTGNQQVYTTYCFWGANGCQDTGSVYLDHPQNWLPTWDMQTRTAGSPLGKISTPVLPDSVPWIYDPRIPDAEKVVRCKDIIAKNPSIEEAKTALVWLYTILRTDYAEDQLGQKSTFFSYLQGLRKSYAVAPLGEQALRYMIFWKMLEKSDAVVIELSQEALKVLTGEEKKWVMADLAFAYARMGQIQEAKGMLQEMRDQYGEDRELIALVDQDITMDEGMLAKGIVAPGEKSSEQELEIPTAFALEQNYPNPFNPATLINYQLPVVSHVTLKVYDILGREVATLVDEMKDAGYYTATFNARNLASGIYFARFTVTDELRKSIYTKSMKLLLMK